jgi:uncharacterized protein YkwD
VAAESGTPETVRAPGRRRARRGLLVIVGAIFVIVGLAGCETTQADRQHVLDLINQSRAQNGLPALRENVTLDIKADGWAQNIRGLCALSHSNLATGAPTNWRKLGENVGFGMDIDQVHVAYMNSPGHRANILDPTFTQAGTAAVYGTCDGVQKVFTVQEFMAT